MNQQLTQQIQNAVLDMYKKVKFDEDNHIYTETETGKWLQGVSEVSSIVPKDWLSAWGAKECVKFLGYSDYKDDIERAEEVLEIFNDFFEQGDIQGYQLFLKEAKGASYRKSQEALVDGKEGHQYLENYIKAKIRNQSLPDIPSGNLERPIKQFIEWANKEVDYWILSEARVAYPEKGYAGTLDGLAIMKDGKLAVIDFKFASHISEDYFLQTAGYQHTFDPYGIKIDERIIVRLPKTLYRDEWDKKERTYKQIENTIEVVKVPTDYKEDIEVFLHCLPLKKWINQIKKI